MTAITGIHPYADKFPMLPKPGCIVFGGYQSDDGVAHTVTFKSSNEHPGYVLISVSAGSGLYETTRPVRSDASGDWAARMCDSEGVDPTRLQWGDVQEVAQSSAPDPNIYFIQDALGRIKIGWAASIASRLKTLQTANSEPLKLIGSMPGSRSDEAALHGRFAKYRVRGEWFEPAKEIKEYIEGSTT